MEQGKNQKGCRSGGIILREQNNGRRTYLGEKKKNKEQAAKPKKDLPK